MNPRPRERRGPRGKFADRLRAARAARGLTQKEAAAELGVALPTVGRWEAGILQPGRFARLHVEAWVRKALGEKEVDNGA